MHFPRHARASSLAPRVPRTSRWGDHAADHEIFAAPLDGLRIGQEHHHRSRSRHAVDARMIDVLYDRGLELASRLNDLGDVVSTMTSRKVAAIRLRVDAPVSVYFFNAKTGLRVDLLFDFPIPAAALAAQATRSKIRSHVFHVASERDLLRLKKIARAERSAPGDAEDIAFLEARRKGSS